jgi:hypothetical protein
VLTEAQLRALEKAQEEKEACGARETAHPGYLGAQDTFYVGTLKGGSRIYQQTFIDTYTRVAHVKLYDRENVLVAADAAKMTGCCPGSRSRTYVLLRVLTDEAPSTTDRSRITNTNCTSR